MVLKMSYLYLFPKVLKNEDLGVRKKYITNLHSAMYVVR